MKEEEDGKWNERFNCRPAGALRNQGSSIIVEWRVPAAGRWLHWNDDTDPFCGKEGRGADS